MGVYSTVEITRQDAMRVILDKLDTATDEQIADLLFDLIGREGVPNSRLENYTIVSEYEKGTGRPQLISKKIQSNQLLEKEQLFLISVFF